MEMIKAKNSWLLIITIIIVGLTSTPRLFAQQHKVVITPYDTIIFDVQDDNVEYEILKALYNGTNGRKWKKRTNWLNGKTSAEFANWYGVVVENGDVVEIHLDNNNLTGSIPKSVFNLLQLRSITYSGNDMTRTEGATISRKQNFSSTMSSPSTVSSVETSPIISGKGLPVWGVAAEGSIQTIDWRNYPPAVETLANSPSQHIGMSGVGIDDCGRLAFYALHSGQDQANQLHIYMGNGTQLTNNTTGSPLLALNCANGNNEIQVVRVPGKADEWYIIHTLWQTPCTMGNSTSSLYCAAKVVYAKVRLDIDNQILTILQRETPISTSTFLQGKAVSRTVNGDPSQHYLYLAQKTINGNTTQIHRFVINSTGINNESISAVTIPATYWLGNIAGSSVELSPQEDFLAITNRNVGSFIMEDLIIFDLSRFSDPTYTAAVISVPNLKVFNMGMTIKELYTTDANFYCLRHLKNKLSFIEFSPSGRYLYVVGGGYPDNSGGVTYATYLLQLDLQSGTGNGDFTVRIQRQVGRGVVNNSCTGSSYNEQDHLIEQIESAYDGRLYFTKRNSSTLFVIPNPDDPMPHDLTPREVSLATASVNDVLLNNGHYVMSMPENIDGLDYLKESTIENFTLDKSIMSTDESVTLSLFDYDPGDLLQVNWGDGTIEALTGADVSHMYNSPGTYKITLTTTYTTTNCTVLTSKTLEVVTCPGWSELSIRHQTYICAVKFSVPKMHNTKGIYLWDFGDGATSQERNPLHAYAEPGTYNVSVHIIYNGISCTEEITLNKSIAFSPMTDPLEQLVIEVKTDQRNEIIATSASSFSDAWLLNYFSEALDNKNGYLNGTQGVWRNDASYVYEKDRTRSPSVDISTDGTFTMEQFNWEHAELDAVPNWVRASSMTQYSPYSYELENRDVLNVYSGAIYDYGGQLPVANGVNMRQNEMAFTSFEHLDEAVTGNWVLGSGTLPVYTSYTINAGMRNMAIIEASLEQLENVVEVEVRANRVIFALWQFNIRKYSRNEIICKEPHPENPDWSIIVLKNAPIEGVWSGRLRIRNIVTPVVTAERDHTVSHSGKSSMKITADKTFKQEVLRLDAVKSYWLNCWVSRNNPSLLTPVLGDNIGIAIIARDKNNQEVATFPFQPAGPMIEGWQQIKGAFACPVSTQYIEIRFSAGNAGTVWFDDLRLHPEQGNMKGYVYNVNDYRLSAVLDEENFASYFYYDQEGNLYLTKKETKDGIKTLTENISYQVER